MYQTAKLTNDTTNRLGTLARSASGYLLTSVLTTIAIIGVLAAITAPTLRAYLPALRLRGEARALVSDLRDAQQRTVTEQVAYYVIIDDTNQRYQVFRDDNPDTLIKTTTLSEGVSIQAINDLSDDTVIFNSYGAVSAAGSIVLVNGLNATSTIAIKPSGYVHVQ